MLPDGASDELTGAAVACGNSSASSASGDPGPAGAACLGGTAEGRRCVVPSAEWPTLASAVARATDGTHIQLLAGHSERLEGPLIVDRAVFVEGPQEGGPAELLGEEGLVVAAGPSRDTVVLRRLRLRVTGTPALVIAGGCTVDSCDVQAATVGVEVAAHSGSAVRIINSLVHGCEVGISLAGGASAALLDGTRIEGCVCGVALTGLPVDEGWSEVLGSLAGTTLVGSSEADLRLRAWSVRERAAGVVRQSPPGATVSVRGWPHEQCNVVAPTDKGPVVLHFNGGRVNATLFEEEDEAGEAGPDDSSGGSQNRSRSCSVGDGEALALQTLAEP